MSDPFTLAIPSSPTPAPLFSRALASITTRRTIVTDRDETIRRAYSGFVRPNELCYTLYDVGKQRDGVILAILFTVGQLRSAFALSKQEWRSYRQALAPLNQDSRRSPCFSAGDLLAIAVVRRVSKTLAAPLSTFSSLAGDLFALCGAYPWPQLERSYLLFDLQDLGVELVDLDRWHRPIEFGLLIRLAPLVAEIRENLLAGGPDPQHDLAFPPMVAGARQ